MGTVQDIISKTLVVIPAFNEEFAIGNVVREIHAAMPGIDIVVIDDGSSDATIDRAREAGAMVAVLPFNLGVGGAMRLGFRIAAENGYENVLQIDGDGQHDPATAPGLLRMLGEYDLILGARFAGKGDYTVGGPRKWAIQVLSAVISRVTKTKLTDTTSGFRASGPRAVAVFAAHYSAEYLGDVLESLIVASRHDLVMTQLPVAMRERAGGTPSHNPLKSALFLARVTVALIFAMVKPAASYRVGNTQ